jgi:enolase-phosphatase E1
MTNEKWKMANGKWQTAIGKRGSLTARAVLLDIEGTTTPISFVYDVLFPFARARINNYLQTNLDSREVQRDMELLNREHAAEIGNDVPPLNYRSRAEQIESVVAYIHWLMDRDRKSTALKSLQGKIWEQGYRDRVLRAQVFADVPAALRRWHESGLKTAIFSSGSVLAQKLLFAHTAEGDLTGFIVDYFDTTTGAKNSSESYLEIATRLHVQPPEVVFISDTISELDAALIAGIKTFLCMRPGNHPQPQALKHSIIHSFAELFE